MCAGRPLHEPRLRPHNFRSLSAQHLSGKHGRAWGCRRVSVFAKTQLLSACQPHLKAQSSSCVDLFLPWPARLRVSPPAAVALYAGQNFGDVKVSQLIVRFYVRSHATLLTFLKAVVWWKLGRMGRMKHLWWKHCGTLSQQMRTVFAQILKMIYF